MPEVSSFTDNVLSDVSRNTPIRTSMKRNLNTSVKNIKRRIVGGGGKSSCVKKKKKGCVKRGKGTKKSVIKKKRGEKRCSKTKKDIFQTMKFDL